MQRARFNQLLAGTAIALTLGLGICTADAQASADTAASAAAPAAATEGTTASAPAADVKPAEASKPAEAKPAEPATPAVTNSVPDSAAPKYVTASVGDAALVDRLRDQFAAGKFDRILGGKKDRGAVEAFYANRSFQPLWITEGAINERGKAATAYLAGVTSDGLDPSDYPTPQAAGSDAEAQAEAEIRLTDAVLTYARHAISGRVHYSRVASDIIYELAKIEPGEVLSKLAGTANAAEVLDGLQPQHPQYKALKAKLAETRNAPKAAPKVEEEKKAEQVRVPEGKMLRPGMSDPRVVALRKRLDIPGNKDNPAYDDVVAEEVKNFQSQAKIDVDGMLGPNTVRALNGERQAARRPTIDPADAIIATMERWRWVPRDLGKTYVMVNIPDYTLRVVRNEKLVWKTRIVVGKPNLPTPLLTAEMKFITVNPTWNVPPSIIQNEYLPALQQDPQAMERIGLKVEQDRDGNIRIWQPPGDRNALGRIRFNFPNKFLVYQHDTPDKHLFAHDRRAYSHGCMRVQDPLKYGEVLLSLVLPQENYTADRLQKMFGGSEININFPNFIPVHITYQTAFVDDAGNLELRDDVYGRDQRLLAVLKGSDRKVAEYAVDRPKGSSTAPVRMPPGTFGGSRFFSGPSFFDRLFGGSSEPPPRPRARVGGTGFDRPTFR
jgi:murein L,D-transpeptidase YcbB/YkuD